MFQLELVRNLNEALQGADAAVIVTRRQEYVELGFAVYGQEAVLA